MKIEVTAVILQRILSLLIGNKSNQKDLCTHIGVSEKTFSTWKSRGTNPPADKLSSIADYFDITLDELITGNTSDTVSLLTTDESELLSNYQKLDNRGKHRLQTIVYDELDRMEEKLLNEKQSNKEDVSLSTSIIEENNTA